MSIPPTLLLADDSLTIQRVVSLTFADQPVRVIVAKDGQDAINRMASERPDLVLADTNMPCVDGYELARWVRRQPHLSTVPVLLLAGVTDPVDEQRLHDSGANGVLEKPFEPSHVISRVKELLGLKSSPPAMSGRLVTAPDIAAPPQKPASGTRQPLAVVEPAAGERASVPPPPFAPPDAHHPPSPAPTPTAEPTPEGKIRGDAQSWFSDDRPVPDSRPSPNDDIGVEAMRFYGFTENAASTPGRDEAASDEGTSAAERSGLAASADDVFESLLAAEQGDARPAPFQAVAPALTPAMLDTLAARVVERLGPEALSQELQRSMATALRDAVTPMLRESMAGDVRAAVAAAVQAAVDGTVVDTVRSAVSEAVSAAMPAAIEQHVAARAEHAVRSSADHAVRTTIEPIVQESLGAPLTALVRDAVAREMREAIVPAIQQTVREAAHSAVRVAVADAAAAVPSAILDALSGSGGGDVRSIVHETADRLIREEIARIRERRP